MSLEVKGGVELRDDVARMADLLRASGGNGTRACNYILQTAAQPVLTRMLHNASTDPKRRSGTLYNSIRIGRVVKKRSGGYRVTVGVHRADGGAKYASPVEFGHGGPHPAPPHPFIRPAFDGGVTNDNLAKGVKGVLDMHFVGFIFGHGNSPSLNNSAGRQHSLLSPLDSLPAKASGAVNGGALRRSS